MTEINSEMKFPFPYEKPYSIQQDFMSHLYYAIETRKVGIFESPTGTGKTLSIICGAFKWLQDSKRSEEIGKSVSAKASTSAEQSTGSSSSTSASKQLPAWVAKQFARQKLSDGESRKRARERELDDYELDLEMMRTTKKRRMTKLDHNAPDFKPPQKLKIIFASRTHSQLAQFASELRKSPYAHVAPITIASRQALCINKEVTKLSTVQAINETCQELNQKGKIDDLEDSEQIVIQTGEKSTKREKSSGCPFHKLTSELNLRSEILQNSIEDGGLVERGRVLKACPYYASRRSVSSAELVLVPYNILLNRDLRKASGLVLEDNILIIDEAHNLTESVASIHATSLDLPSLQKSYIQVKNYRKKYSSRFSPKNARNLDIFLEMLTEFQTFMTASESDQPTSKSNILRTGEFVLRAKLDKFNLQELILWVEQMSLCRKLLGVSPVEEIVAKTSAVAFVKKCHDAHKGRTTELSTSTKEGSRHGLFKVMSFLRMIYSETSEDSRIVLDHSSGTIKYLLLNASNVFSDIVNEPRACIIAGGTMKPVDSFILQLLPKVPKSRVHEFSCGHVVDVAKQLLPICLSTDAAGKALDYRFASRSLPQTIEATKRLLMNFCRVIPAGVVVFFPSYALLKTYHEGWKLERFGKKAIVVEPKTSTECDKVLKKYASLCEKENGEGAVLLSVVGGKLAEGINFNDDLGRGVFVIGQPYPDIKSPVLQEKLTFLKEANDTSNYCDTLCWRSINQSIGRAIRHQNDYAVVVLMDQRYGNQYRIRLLPDWILSHVKIEPKFATAFTKVREFFKQRK